MTFDADNYVSPANFIKKKSVTFDKTDNIINIVTRDHEGNQLNGLTGTVNSLNQYTQFDQWGFNHDANGNTSQKGTQSFTYDFKNRMITTTDGSTTVNFKYDVLGRRIEKSVGSNSTKYFYTKNRVIEERDISDAVTKQYIYGNGIDEIIRMDNNESGTMTPYYYHTNSIGNVTAITDNTGNLIERVDYDIYGMPTIWDYKTDPNNPTVVSNSLIGNAILFHGRRYDPETNLYYYRARYYDPITGRFLSTDPMGYQDSMNLYQAFNMNGVNFLDPMGELITLTGSNYEKNELLWLLRFGVAEKYWKFIQLTARNGKTIINPSLISKLKSDSINIQRLREISIDNKKNTEVSFAEKIMINGNKYELDFDFNGYTKDNIESKGSGYFNRVFISRKMPKAMTAITLAHELLGHAYLETKGEPYKHEILQEKSGKTGVNFDISKIEDHAKRNFLNIVKKWRIGKLAIKKYLKQKMNTWKNRYPENIDYANKVELSIIKTLGELGNSMIDFSMSEWLRKWNLSKRK